MSVHDATCGDIYRDKHGKLWMVRWTCREPTVGMVELSHEPLDEHQTMSGGVSGLMWEGFRKLLAAQGIEARSDETPQEVQPEGREPGPQGCAQTPRSKG